MDRLNPWWRSALTGALVIGAVVLLSLLVGVLSGPTPARSGQDAPRPSQAATWAIPRPNGGQSTGALHGAP